MKSLATLLLAVASATAIWQIPVQRYRANLSRRQIEMLVVRAEASASEHARRTLALRAIELTHQPLEIDPTDYRTLILKGAAEAAAGRSDAALATYRHALTVNERPEIYAYMGILQMERGEVDDAMANLLKASDFDANLINLVAPSTQQAISAELKRRQTHPEERHHR